MWKSVILACRAWQHTLRHTIEEFFKKTTHQTHKTHQTTHATVRVVTFAPSLATVSRKHLCTNRMLPLTLENPNIILGSQNQHSKPVGTTTTLLSGMKSIGISQNYHHLFGNLRNRAKITTWNGPSWKRAPHTELVANGVTFAYGKSILSSKGTMIWLTKKMNFWVNAGTHKNSYWKTSKIEIGILDSLITYLLIIDMIILFILD